MTDSIALTPEQQELFDAHVGLVDWIAVTKAGNSPYFDDIRQECLIAYAQSILRYRDDKGMKFTTYATQRLKWTVLSYWRGKRSDKTEPDTWSLDVVNDSLGESYGATIPDPSFSWDDVDRQLDAVDRMAVFLRWCEYNMNDVDRAIIVGLVQDKAPHEIAAEIGLGRAAVSYRMKGMREGYTNRVDRGPRVAIPWHMLRE